MKKSTIIIMNLKDEVLKEEVYCNNLNPIGNLINSVTFNSFDTVLTNKEEKELIVKNIKNLKYGYIYEDNKYKYWIRK